MKKLNTRTKNQKYFREGTAKAGSPDKTYSWK